VAIPTANSFLLRKVYEDCRKLGLQVVVLPPLHEFLSRRTSSPDLRNISIEDLVDRDQRSLESPAIEDLVRGKRVVVTGAGGSIGSELARQLGSFDVAELYLVDRDESALLEAGLAFESGQAQGRITPWLMDIRDDDSVCEFFRSSQVDIVFHAAALKHVTFLERFPSEAWKTNVEGTLNLLRAASSQNVSVFVNISTDKAANATTVLGRSKALAEHLTAWFAAANSTRFVSVRFGNVLGSRGSLIPILAKQIQVGGPITITDRRATRYFMSIPEACQLVLQAVVEGVGGDVLLLDMGEPVSIQDIADRMVEMSGRSIDIVYTGLRPGEKLHEDLLSDFETAVPSSHPKILRLRATPKSPDDVWVEKW
jgi:FlaA1/EpsC-like NDP-sugar epimerase